MGSRVVFFITDSQSTALKMLSLMGGDGEVDARWCNTFEQLAKRGLVDGGQVARPRWFGLTEAGRAAAHLVELLPQPAANEARRAPRPPGPRPRSARGAQ